MKLFLICQNSVLVSVSRGATSLLNKTELSNIKNINNVTKLFLKRVIEYQIDNDVELKICYMATVNKLYTLPIRVKIGSYPIDGPVPIITYL